MDITMEGLSRPFPMASKARVSPFITSLPIPCLKTLASSLLHDKSLRIKKWEDLSNSRKTRHMHNIDMFP